MRPTTTDEIECSPFSSNTRVYQGDALPTCPPGEACIRGIWGTTCMAGCTSEDPCPMGMECDLKPQAILGYFSTY